ncbi:MAG: flagellar basal body rod protein FlgB [Halioglobus sp.]
MNVIDRHLGISPDALSVRARRIELLSANLANADTPGYKARDIDFGETLARVRDGQGAMRTTHSTHIQAGSGAHNMHLKYRVPSQASLDGNTVETQQEHAAFMDNAIRYQASLNFLDGRIKSIISALRME